MIKSLISALFISIALNTFAQSAEIEPWVEDLDLYKVNLEKYHIDLYNTISKAEFEYELEQLKSNLNKKTDTDIIIDLMRLTRKNW